jgi:hypothetical protein
MSEQREIMEKIEREKVGLSFEKELLSALALLNSDLIALAKDLAIGRSWESARAAFYKAFAGTNPVPFLYVEQLKSSRKFKDLVPKIEATNKKITDLDIVYRSKGTSRIVARVLAKFDSESNMNLPYYSSKFSDLDLIFPIVSILFTLLRFNFPNIPALYNQLSSLMTKYDAYKNLWNTDSMDELLIDSVRYRDLFNSIEKNADLCLVIERIIASEIESWGIEFFDRNESGKKDPHHCIYIKIKDLIQQQYFRLPKSYRLD